MKTKHTTKTDVGEMITASYIVLSKIKRTKHGCIEDAGAITFKIALREDGGGWEPLYDQGGDDCGISHDDMDDVITIGRMDDSCNTVSKALLNGARELRYFASLIAEIGNGNESMMDAAQYLISVAAGAKTAAKNLEACNALADEYQLDREGEENEE